MVSGPEIAFVIVSALELLPFFFVVRPVRAEETAFGITSLLLVIGGYDNGLLRASTISIRNFTALVGDGCCEKNSSRSLKKQQQQQLTLGDIELSRRG
jgi:hypothetical protein